MHQQINWHSNQKQTHTHTTLKWQRAKYRRVDSNTDLKIYRDKNRKCFISSASLITRIRSSKRLPLLFSSLNQALQRIKSAHIIKWYRRNLSGLSLQRQSVPSPLISWWVLELFVSVRPAHLSTWIPESPLGPCFWGWRDALQSIDHCELDNCALLTR